MGPGIAESESGGREVVFVSYCHADLQWVQRFQVLLKPLLRRHRLQLWADTAIVGSQEWHPAIERAIARSVLGLLLVSGDFLASDYIMERELPALFARGVPVAPVLIGSCLWDEVPELARVQWLHDPGRDGPLDIDADRAGRRDERLVQICRSLIAAIPVGGRELSRSVVDRGQPDQVAEVPGGARPGDLYGVPEPPRGYVERDELTGLINSVVAAHSGAVGLTTEPTAVGLHGQGGIGKSVLVAALGRDERIRSRFPDGIYWVTIGERADLLAVQLDLLARLGGAGEAPRTVADAIAQLTLVLSPLRVLLLVDDVWSDAGAHAFRVTGPHGRVVYTARDARVVESVGAQLFGIGLLSVEAARAVAVGVLGAGAPALPSAADQAFAAVDRVALAVALLSAAVRGGRSWGDVAEDLSRDADVYGDHPYANTFKAMQIAVEALQPDVRSALLRLAVFPTDTAVPLPAIARYWARVRGGTVEDAAYDLDRLATANVLTRDRDRITFHDLQHDFLLLHAPPLPTLHADLLDAYRATLPPDEKDQWWRLPVGEPYIWEQLIHHLRGAGERRELLKTVTDPAFLTMRIGGYGVHAAEADLAAAQEASGTTLPIVQWWRAWLGRHAHLLRGFDGASPFMIAPTVLAWLRADPTRPAAVDPGRLTTMLSPHHLTPRWGLVPPSTMLVRVLVGHPNAVGVLAWAPDGRRLAAADDDWEVRVWDVAAGSTVATLVGHRSEIKTVAWGTDGREIHTVSDDWEIRSWEAGSGRPVSVGRCQPTAEDARRLLHGGKHAFYDYDFDGESIAGDWTDLVNSGDTAEQTDASEHVVAAAWAPDATHLAIATDLGRVWIWNREASIATGVLRGVGEDVLALAWSADGTRLATAGSDRDVVIWDSATGRELGALVATRLSRGRRDRVFSLAWRPDGGRLGAGLGDSAHTWDVPSGQVVEAVPVKGARDLVVAWSADAEYLAAAGAGGKAQVWSGSRRVATGLRGHTDTLLALAWSPDGSCLATAGRDREIRLWAPAATLSPAKAGLTDAVVSVAWSPSGRHLATAESDNAIRVRDGQAGHVTAAVIETGGRIVEVAWSPDAKRLATAGPSRVAQVWDAATGGSIAKFTGHSAQVISVDWCPDGRRLASAALDREVHVWHATTGSLLVELIGHAEGVSRVAWSPDGDRLATASLDGDARVWAAHTGHTLTVLEGKADWLRTVAWSPDGLLLATGGDDRQVRIWDSHSGRTEMRLGSHDTSVVALAWSPDGRALASCGSDGILLIHALDGSYTHRLQLETATSLSWTGSVIAIGRSNSVAVFDIHL